MEPTDSDQPRRRPRHPLEGRTLNGRYEILDVVGSGGMATVFRARDVRLGRDVAIKVLHPQYAADDAFVERFRQEAEFAAGLSAHPNIVSIFDVGEDGDSSYIVMELVAGRNLKDLIAAEGPIPVDRAFRIGQQIASALEFAHRRGLVHRDVKPQNILVSDDDSVKVTDFGIARSAASTQMTRTGMVMGSAHYLSPEQAQGQPADASSDIYALGIVLFEMLTGRVPFDADNPLGVAMKQVHEPPPPPNRINPAVSPSAAAVVLRALNKDPADRYRSAAEFGLAMQQQDLPDAGQTMVNRPVHREVAAAEAPTTVVRRQGPPPPRTPRVAREVTPPPNPWRRTLLIFGLIALVILAALGSWFALASAFGTKHTPTPTTSPTATSTPRATATQPAVVHVSTPTPTPTLPPAPPTNTSPPPPTNTPKPRPTNTPKPNPTNTSVPTNTPIPTNTPVPATPTPVPTNTPIG